MYYIKTLVLSRCINIYLADIIDLQYETILAAAKKSSPFFCQCAEFVLLIQEKAEGSRRKCEEELPRYCNPIQVDR